MQQSQYKSNFELKFLARVQTGQHMGILAGSLLLKLLISFLSVNLITALIPARTTTGYIVNYIMTVLVQIAVSVLSVGTSLIFLKSACSMQAVLGDLFCGFQQNTVKILKIGAVITIINSICMIPLDIASVQYSDMINSIPLFQLSRSDYLLDNHELLATYNVFYSASMKFYLIMLVCTVVSTILTLPFFPAFFMVLDFPNLSASEILKKCFEVMHGNKLRLFMLYLSFVPSFLLSIFTCGITLIWVLPYMSMAETNFYLDMMSIRNKSVGY
ncbi:MAG: DUF975 family protein [Lachnospiraceae bacterium]|nr:DUF975 family protein [Lachnospiraceae bacterium]